jgi:metalloendopeptidase OMA1, mitochondrial
VTASRFARRQYHPRHAATLYPVVTKTSKPLKWFHNAFLGTLVLGGAYLVSCVEEAPVTGRRRLMVVSEELEEAIGHWYGKEVQSDGLPADHPDVQLVQRVTTRVMRSANRLMGNEKQWTVVVVPNSEVNAFCAPGRVVVVHTGLIRKMQDLYDLSNKMTNPPMGMPQATFDAIKELGPIQSSVEDMLGAIISHEAAHAVARHSAEKMTWLPFFLLVSIVGASSPIIASMVDLGMRLPMSRQLEAEADTIGMRIAAGGCFDLRAAAEFHRRVRLGAMVDSDLLSTHPSDSSRAEKCSELADELKGYQIQECGKVCEYQPRGFFG